MDFLLSSLPAGKAYLLTAAHCLYGCAQSSNIVASVGEAHRLKGLSYTAQTFIVHNKYDEKSATNDIALVKLDRPLPFSQTAPIKIGKLFITQQPPKTEYAYVTGWGVQTDKYDNSKRLRALKQTVFSTKRCFFLMDGIPPNTICAMNVDKNAEDQADSGSPLVINIPNSREYIQIGIVSYKIPKISESIMVYTNVARFYNWIINRGIKKKKNERLKSRDCKKKEEFEDLTLNKKSQKVRCHL